MFFKTTKIGIKVLILLILGIILGLQSCKSYIEASTRIKTPQGISSLEEIELGGHQQWIFIRGTDITNPILLFLHGGPGEPVLGMPSSRSQDSDLIQHFTVVHWDQLGAGKSYNKSISSVAMSFDNWVEDCRDLIDTLRNRYQAEKIFLLGHSGGSIVGMKVADKYPEKLYAYVGVSQIFNYNRQQLINYKYILNEAKRRDDVKTMKAILEIGSPPYGNHKKELDKGKLIVKYGGFTHTNTMKLMGSVLMSYLTSPEYSLKEALQTISGKGLNFTRENRYEEIEKLNFTKEIDTLKTAVYFFQGKYDMVTPTSMLKEFYNDLIVPNGKSLVVFENSAHMPIIEEKDKYEQTLINSVLNEIDKGNSL